MNRIVISGGTGHLGSSLANRLINEGYNVSILTRNMPSITSGSIHYILWDGISLGPWIKYIEECDIVINFCGKSVDCRYTESNKLKLIHSRVKTTQLLGEAIKRSLRPPRVWINASSSAYYGFSTEVMDERSSPGNDFPARICVEWEKAFENSYTPSTRKVALRLGVVLQKSKGLLLPFVRLVKLFVGGKLGHGSQYFTWIHEEDFFSAVVWAIMNSQAMGAYNITSPVPVTNADFMKALRDAIGVPVGISLPEWFLKIGGKIIGMEPYLILDGRRIIPKRLLDSNFQFQYPQIKNALNNLCKEN